MVASGRPVALLTRESWIRHGTGRAQFLLLMDALARIGPAMRPAEGLEGDAPAMSAIGAGPSVMVVIEPGLGWARLAAQAGMSLEAGDEV